MFGEWWIERLEREAYELRQRQLEFLRAQVSDQGLIPQAPPPFESNVFGSFFR